MSRLSENIPNQNQRPYPFPSPSQWAPDNIDPRLHLAPSSTSELAGALSLPTTPALLHNSTLANAPSNHSLSNLSNPDTEIASPSQPAGPLQPLSGPRRYCSVKGCKAVLGDGYYFKMCEPCRDKYRGYGNTKRAKWKKDRVANKAELDRIRKEEDEKRAALGLPPIAKLPSSRRQDWEMKVLNHLADRSDGSNPSASPPSSYDSLPGSATSVPLKLCTVSHCHAVLPAGYKYRRCEAHRLQNRYHSKLKRVREKEVKGTGSAEWEETPIDPEILDGEAEGGEPTQQAGHAQQHAPVVPVLPAMTMPTVPINQVESQPQSTVVQNQAEGARPPPIRGMQRTNHICSVKLCHNLLGPQVPWKMCEQCRERDRQVRTNKGKRKRERGEVNGQEDESGDKDVEQPEVAEQTLPVAESQPGTLTSQDAGVFANVIAPEDLAVDQTLPELSPPDDRRWQVETGDPSQRPKKRRLKAVVSNPKPVKKDMKDDNSAAVSSSSTSTTANPPAQPFPYPPYPYPYYVHPYGMMPSIYGPPPPYPPLPPGTTPNQPGSPPGGQAPGGQPPPGQPPPGQPPYPPYPPYAYPYPYAPAPGQVPYGPYNPYIYRPYPPGAPPAQPQPQSSPLTHASRPPPHLDPPPIPAHLISGTQPYGCVPAGVGHNNPAGPSYFGQFSVAVRQPVPPPVQVQFAADVQTRRKSSGNIATSQGGSEASALSAVASGPAVVPFPVQASPSNLLGPVPSATASGNGPQGNVSEQQLPSGQEEADAASVSTAPPHHSASEVQSASRQCSNKSCHRTLPAETQGTLCEKCKQRMKKKLAKTKQRHKLEPKKPASTSRAKGNEESSSM
ncbi:hypothetical protein OE88DRAFT_761139 [Heliocybe sulcata]|uniref:Uncharacterized protein n=1 Tax=Heliocybe sulcata TaxID=5364 RepID=A0A5C3MRH1_9AGAM|nr:hypothetical protein OE88DRAFT_761139 [Heliocybe sulcata]